LRTIDWSETAIDQYESALDWLAERNPEAAERLAERIQTTIEGLARRPIGRPGQREGTYEKAVLRTAYLVIYSLVGGPEGQLRILRIYHTAQNWTAWSPEPDETT
jgi:plasmid stabilization system protein ParE